MYLFWLYLRRRRRSQGLKWQRFHFSPAALILSKSLNAIVSFVTWFADTYHRMCTCFLDNHICVFGSLLSAFSEWKTCDLANMYVVSSALDLEHVMFWVDLGLQTRGRLPNLTQVSAYRQNSTLSLACRVRF